MTPMFLTCAIGNILVDDIWLSVFSIDDEILRKFVQGVQCFAEFFL